MGIDRSKPHHGFNRLDRAIKDAKADGKITASEAKRIIGRAQAHGIDARERALLQSLSKDTFLATTSVRRLFADAIERPPKPIVK